MVAETTFAQRVAAVRRFNRFYTRKIGVLHEGYLKSPFSLAQVRVLYELAHRDGPTATELSRDLGLDAGYLSRILRHFEKQGLIRKTPSESDGRQSFLSLTLGGQEAFHPLDARSRDEMGTMLSHLSEAGQHRLLEALHVVEGLLDAQPQYTVPYIIRPPQPGDMGWVVHRHAVLYAQEHGWGEEFEADVAAAVASFTRRRDAKRERCWIAEREGEIAGCVFLVTHSATVGRLRFLLVEPSARRLGIGGRLVGEVVRFGRQAKYRRITLRTVSAMRAARRLFEKTGFRLVHSARSGSLGRDLGRETWELKL